MADWHIYKAGQSVEVGGSMLSLRWVGSEVVLEPYSRLLCKLRYDRLVYEENFGALGAAVT